MTDLPRVYTGNGWVPMEPAYSPALPVVRAMLDAFGRDDRVEHLALNDRLNDMQRSGETTGEEVDAAIWDTGYNVVLARLGNGPGADTKEPVYTTGEELHAAMQRGMDVLLANGWMR